MTTPTTIFSDGAQIALAADGSVSITGLTVSNTFRVTLALRGYLDGDPVLSDMETAEVSALMNRLAGFLTTVDLP